MRTLVVAAIMATLVGFVLFGCGTESEPLIETGSSDVYAQDRAAITNLINSYAFHVDDGEVDAFVGLFSDDAEVEYTLGDQVVSGKEAFELVRERTEWFKGQGIQRRHVITNLAIRDQTSEEADGTAYVLLMTNEDGQSRLVTTGKYTFTVRKQDGRWQITRWFAVADGTMD